VGALSYHRRLHTTGFCPRTHKACAQASQAAISLQHNIAAESAAIVGFLDMYHAAITAHQAVRGKLAAWPDYIQPFRLMEYLGALCRRALIHSDGVVAAANKACVSLPWCTGTCSRLFTVCPALLKAGQSTDGFGICSRPQASNHLTRLQMSSDVLLR